MKNNKVKYTEVPDVLLDLFSEKKRTFFPYKQYEILNFKCIKSRIYQEPGRCCISIGIDWSSHPVLFHLHILFWEIDLEVGL